MNISKKQLVYSCSGCSSAAQAANAIAVRLDRNEIAEMSCIAGVGGDVIPLVRVAKSGRPITVIDGCPLHCAKKGGKTPDNKMALSWTIGTAVLSFVGAGFLGFAHTIPQVNIYTHGTLVTAMHGHLAFWGAYACLVLAMITYAMPHLTGRKMQDTAMNIFAFWTSNIGMLAMTVAFGIAGVAQVYLERRIGIEFLAVQKEIAVHFLGLVLAATLFTGGIIAFVWNFIRFGKPVGEVQK